MQISQFAAKCPLEIGDRINMGDKCKTITDIACTHYCKTGKVEFSVELDNSGRYLKVECPQASKVVTRYAEK